MAVSDRRSKRTPYDQGDAILHDYLDVAADCLLEGRSAILCRLSRVREHPYGHRWQLVARCLDRLAGLDHVRLFRLPNEDVVIVQEQQGAADAIEAALGRISSLFSDAVTMQSEVGEGAFIVRYDLARPQELRRLRSLIGRESRKVLPPLEPVAPSAKAGAFDPTRLAEIGRRVHEIDLAPLIHRQTAVEVRPGASAVPLFEDLYVAPDEVVARLAPDLDPSSNVWLLRSFCRILDRRLLACVATRGLLRAGVPTCLPVSLATLLDARFERPLAACGARAGELIVEIHLVDALADRHKYVRARDWLRGLGHKVAVGGIDPLAPQALSLAELAADFLKLRWDPEMAGACPLSRQQEVHHTLAVRPDSNVILAQVGSEDTLKWGVNLGIRRFQGPLVDRLLAESGCPSAAPSQGCRHGR